MQEFPADPRQSRAEYFCHASLWYGVLFAVPMLIAASNRQEIPQSLWALGAGLFAAALVVSLISFSLVRLLPDRGRSFLVATLLALSAVLAIQATLIHPLADFGRFDGSIVNFRKYGNYFWLEWLGFLACLGMLAGYFFRLKSRRSLFAWVPFLLFTSLWLPALLTQPGSSDAKENFDDSVFEFSSQLNLIHLLPDGLQGDVVEQVFAENPELAKQFAGFTLFADHLGMYHGTAPAIPTLLTGEPFDFERGHSYEWISPFIERHSYQNQLAERGFELDLVHIDSAYCVASARSCVSRPFSDWKSRGYHGERSDSRIYSLKLLADLSLYRLTPAYLKEKIHNQGEWLLAGSAADGASAWPDPVIREWTEQMEVSTDEPRYKWYHYIGTHKPPFWNAGCERQAVLPRTRDHFLGQAECVLSGIAMLLQKLELEGIYDQTAIIVSGDHGHDIPPADSQGPPQSVALTEEMMGTARPALLVKELNSRAPFHINQEASSLIDIPEIALNYGDASGIDRDTDRSFYHYSVEDLASWSNQAVPYDRYRISGPVQDEQSWKLTHIQSKNPAPFGFPIVTFTSASDYLRGARLNPNDPDKELAWIDHKQFAFLISLTPENTQASSVVLAVHIPEWIGQQSFTASVNGVVLDETFNIETQKQFWQEVTIPLSAHAIQSGSNFISLDFQTLHTSPENSKLNAAGLLKSIHVKSENLASDH